MAYDYPSEWETGRPWNQPEEKKEWNIKDYPELNAIFERISGTSEWDTFWDFAEKNGLIKGGKYDDSSWLAQALPAYEAYKKAGSSESQDKAIEDAKKAQEEAEVQKAEDTEADILNKDYWEWRKKYPEAAKEFEASPEWESVANVKMSEGNTPLANAVNKWKERVAAEAAAGETKTAEKEAEEVTTETPTQTETTAGDVEGGDDNYGSRTQQAEIQQGMSDSADAAQQEAYNNYVQNATAGINRSRAGLLADQGTDATQNVQANYNANRQLGTSTQNDYLQKMQQAKAMQQQANNIKAGSFLNTMSGMLQGAGSGAALGAAI